MNQAMEMFNGTQPYEEAKKALKECRAILNGGIDMEQKLARPKFDPRINISEKVTFRKYGTAKHFPSNYENNPGQWMYTLEHDGQELVWFAPKEAHDQIVAICGNDVLNRSVQVLKEQDGPKKFRWSVIEGNEHKTIQAPIEVPGVLEIPKAPTNNKEFLEQVKAVMQKPDFSEKAIMKQCIKESMEIFDELGIKEYFEDMIKVSISMFIQRGKL